MDKVIGNYLTQTGNDFPLDCEALDYIQKNNCLTEMLGNIAGDKTFLTGCVKSGSSYSAGYVFLKTTDYPEGEILYWGGGNSPSSRLYVNVENIAVSANGTTYSSAYTKRTLSNIPTTYDSVGYALGEFTYANYNKPVYGEVKIFAGPLAKIPEGYCLCDGRELDIDEYPNLYAVLGTMYNTQHKGNSYSTVANSTPGGYNYNSNDYYTTTSGKFRIPDMSSRFVWGCGSTGKAQGSDIDSSGYALGSQGGLSSFKLSSGQSGLPEHSHTHTQSIGNESGHWHSYGGDDQLANAFDQTRYGNSACTYSGTAGNWDWTSGSGGSSGYYRTIHNSGHNHTISLTINNTVKEAVHSHENKPPFVVMAYIIRIK